MTVPWLSGLGAALSEGAQGGMEERRRLRALQQAQAQFELEQGQFEESKRHNAALEALQQTQLTDARASTEALRRRQDVDTFRAGAAGGGVNYLDPQRAYDYFHPSPTPDQGGTMGGVQATALDAFNQDGRDQYLGGMDKFAQQLSRENRSAGLVPDSDQFGGAVLENRSWNPYSAWGIGGGGQANQEGQDARSAQDDIRQGGDTAQQTALREATEIQKLTDMSVVNARAESARKSAQLERARFWSRWLTSRYPQKAHLYSIEALLGQAEGPAPATGVQPPQGQPGSNRFMPGVQQQGQSPAPAAPGTVQTGNRFLR